MRHKYDRKIDKKNKYCTCINCGVVKEVGSIGMGYIYFKPNSQTPYLKSPDCKPMFNGTKLTNEEINNKLP